MPQSHLVVWRLRLPSLQMLSPVQVVLRVISLPFLIQLFKLLVSPLRTLSSDQLNELTDEQLMHQAFQVLTFDNIGGTMHLADGSIVSMRQCIDEFAVTSKTRDCATIKRLLKEKMHELEDIAWINIVSDVC